MGGYHNGIEADTQIRILSQHVYEYIISKIL